MKICLAQILGAHGVRGLVKLKSFTEDPASVIAYGPLTDESGRRSFVVALKSMAKDHWLAHIEGVESREAAEALRGVRLHVERSALPEPAEEEFYHADLIGLRAERADGTVLGTVAAIHEFGAGEMVEIRLPDAGSLAVPFTRAAVPVIDVAGGRIVVEPPPEQEEDDDS